MARKRKRRIGGLGSVPKTHVRYSHRGSRAVSSYLRKAKQQDRCSAQRLHALKDAAVAYGYTLAHEKSSGGKAHIGRRMQVLAGEIRGAFYRYDRDCTCNKKAGR